MSAPFVGREDELDELLGLARRAPEHRAPAVALVTGEPGSGKTRLLTEALQRSPVRNIRITGFEPSQLIPLAAAGELLRQLAKVPDAGPNLEALVFGGPDAPARESLRIFEAAHRALSLFGPLLLAIDDLQWVDEQSLALVHYLLRAAEAGHGRLTIIAVGRPSPGAAAFRSSMETELPAGRRAVLDLGPLALEEGLSLARSTNAGLSEAAAIELWRQARGSPFWVEELARAGGVDDRARLFGERLSALRSDAGAVLAALAVGARPFAVEDVGQVLGWEIERVLHASRELVARGLALDSSGRLRLAHDLIREAAYGLLPTADRRRLDQLLAVVIEARAGDDQHLLYEALEHRAAGGLPTAALASRLLSSPQRRLLGSENLRLLTSSSDSVEPGTPLQVSLDRALAELAAELGEPELAMQRWARVARHSPDPKLRQHAEIESARAAYTRRQAEEARAHLERARSMAPLSAEVAVRIGVLQAEIELWLDHETAAGSRTADRALAVAHDRLTAGGRLNRMSGAARRAYVGALAVATDAAMQEDRLADVIRLAETSMSVAVGLDEESYVAALMRIGFSLQPTRRVQEREALFREARDTAQRLAMPGAIVEASHGLARVLQDLGRLGEAHEVAAQAMRLESRLKDAPRRWGNGLAILHAIELSLGDPAAAVRALRSDAAAEPDPHFRIGIHLSLAEWQARSGGAPRASEVEAELTAAQSDAALARCPRCSRELSIVTAELLARIGRVEDAKRELAGWEQAVGDGSGLRELWLMRSTAAILMAQGDELEAAALLVQIADVYEREGLLEELVWVRIDLGRALSRIDRAGSIEAFTAAAMLADRIGAVSEGRVVAQALRRLGVRAWRRGRATGEAGLDRLSTREHEVARLVADGGSNREIAETLLVSPKTVERHITNVLAKLGVRNRTELAAVVRSTPVRGSPDE